LLRRTEAPHRTLRRSLLRKAAFRRRHRIENRFHADGRLQAKTRHKSGNPMN